MIYDFEYAIKRWKEEDKNEDGILKYYKEYKSMKPGLIHGLKNSNRQMVYWMKRLLRLMKKCYYSFIKTSIKSNFYFV